MTQTEIEVKLRLRDAAEGTERLGRAGFVVTVPRVFETNRTFDTPEQSLRHRGCVLRIRVAGAHYVVTFKGPSEPGRYKMRPEIEFAVSDSVSAENLLRSLGYEIAFKYEKWRTEYHDETGQGVATLDETPIGAFLELEGPAEWIDQAAARLGFTADQYITESYGRLYLDYCAELCRTPTDMLFSENGIRS
jgi:adenylate cyclase class 2